MKAHAFKAGKKYINALAKNSSFKNKKREDVFSHSRADLRILPIDG
jgi:hypothetical protein